MKTIGVVLAGGLSRRFGSPKAFAEMEGRYFYEYAVNALKPYCDEVIIVTRPEFVERFPSEFQVITDDLAYAGYGPLAGIYSAMKTSAAMRYMVLPCDMPYMNEQFIGKLLIHEEADVVAVQTAAYHHPLVSIWKRTVLKKLEKTLDQKQFRVVPFLEQVQTKWVDAEVLADDFEEILKNINHQADLERGEEI